MMPPEIGEFFTWAELTRSITASRYGIPNELTARAALALVDLVEDVLDPLRRHLGRAIAVTSGYRSPTLNAHPAVGGSRTSQHVKGEAVDIRVRGMDAASLAREVIASGVAFDQLIWYALERGGHVHISYRKGDNRGQVLHARSGGGFIPLKP